MAPLFQLRVVGTADVVQRRCRVGESTPRSAAKPRQDNFWVDYEWISPSRFGHGGLKPSHPIYKPEFWDKIQELDQWTNKYDPVMTCQPMGLPREGTPARIIQTATDIIFSVYNQRLRRWKHGIPRHPDRRPQRARTRSKPTTMGLSIGKWEGDTLVIDSTNFVDTTWFGRGGLLPFRRHAHG